MVKVVDFKDRAIERVQTFRDTPATLGALVHARYQGGMPDVFVASKGKSFKAWGQTSYVPYSKRKHKPHQMHSQHRDSLVRLITWLIKKMDVTTRECVFVNPRYNINRPIYVPEMARHTGLCDRTITRCLGSLTRSRYMYRANGRYYLSLSLFRDLKLDVTLGRLVSQLAGLKKRNAKQGSGPGQQSGASKSKNAPPQQGYSPAHQPFPFNRQEPGKKVDGSLANAALEAISGLIGRRRRPPSPS